RRQLAQRPPQQGTGTAGPEEQRQMRQVPAAGDGLGQRVHRGLLFKSLRNSSVCARPLLLVLKLRRRPMVVMLGSVRCQPCCGAGVTASFSTASKTTSRRTSTLSAA